MLLNTSQQANDIRYSGHSSKVVPALKTEALRVDYSSCIFSLLCGFHLSSDPIMPIGTLEVLLVDAKGLDNNDFMADMDPYVLLTVNTQEKKSTVVSAQGSNPEWNETFLFTISDDSADLHLKIMEKDNFSADDYVGEAIISLEPVFEEGSLLPTEYNVVNQEKEYRGGIKVGLKFTPEAEPEERSEYRSGEGAEAEESYGGWKQSSYGEE